MLIETILAAFEMDEILYELRQHSAGLNCGRWDYIFSIIKKLRAHPAAVLPDRQLVTMTAPFMQSYCRLLVSTCHRRGVHAMGGMAAQIPVPGDAAANAAAVERVRQDKEREVRLGHDGTWVAHPALIPVAMRAFDAVMSTPHQIGRRDAGEGGSGVTAAELLALPPQPAQVTRAGLLSNIDVCLSYLSPWLRGVGCVPIHGLMEDAATAEISRCQLWQWRRHGALMQGEAAGRQQRIDLPLLQAALLQVVEGRRRGMGQQRWEEERWQLAADLLLAMVSSPQLDDFLTLIAYPHIIETAAQTRSRL